MASLAERFPETVHLLGAYLLPDGDSAEDQLAGYVTALGPERARVTLAEMQELIEGDYDDNEVTSMVTAAGFNLLPEGGKETLRYFASLLQQLL